MDFHWLILLSQPPTTLPLATGGVCPAIIAIPTPCLASSRDRPWNRHCKELDRCSFIRDATIGRTSTIRPRVGRQRHQWPAIKGWRRRWGTWICFQDEAVQILRPPKPQHGHGQAYPGGRGVGQGAPAGSRSPAWPVSSPATGVPRRPTSDPNPAYPTAGADGDAWRRPASPPGCTGSAATLGSTGASRAVEPDMIDELITSGPRRPVSNQAAGITLWLSRNILVES